jgi:hypothetical protein
LILNTGEVISYLSFGRGLYFLLASWGFRVCGRDHGAALDLPGAFEESPLDPKPF